MNLKIAITIDGNSGESPDCGVTVEGNRHLAEQIAVAICDLFPRTFKIAVIEQTTLNSRRRDLSRNDI